MSEVDQVGGRRQFNRADDVALLCAREAVVAAVCFAYPRGATTPDALGVAQLLDALATYRQARDEYLAGH